MLLQFKIYRVFVFFLFTISLLPWFMWDFPTQYISVLGAIYTIVLIMNGRIMSMSKRKVLPIIAFLFLYMWLAKYVNALGHIESIANWIIMVGIIALKDCYRCAIFQFITKWFSILILVSLFFYILYIIGIPLPHTSTTVGIYDTRISNYYTFVVIDGSYRFQSIFREPGYLTMGVAPLLFLNQYNYKNKYVLILLAAQVFSFSLAGYIVMAIGYIYSTTFSDTNGKLKRIIIPLILFIGFIYISIGFFKENLFQDLIMSRLEWQDGTISGNNRSSDYLDFRFEQTLKSSDFFTGSEYDREFSEKGVAGFKLYYVMYGLIGMLLFLWAYLKTFFSFTNGRIISYGFLLVSFLLLYQAAYPTMWSYLILLTCFSAALESN